MSNFKPTWLIIKQHKITGLKYFCKTVNKDPLKYKGSGTIWRRHLKVHGNDIITVWCQLFTDKEELQKYAIQFSIDNDIVNAKDALGNKIWANLIVENGVDGGGNAGMQMPLTQKEKLCDEWVVITPTGKEEHITNMLDYCRKNNLNASAMSAVARGNRSNYKGYKCKKITNNRNIPYEPKEFKYMSKEDRSRQLKELAIKGGNHCEAVKIEFNGIIYDSISEAKADTGKSYYLITKYGKRI